MIRALILAALTALAAPAAAEVARPWEVEHAAQDRETRNAVFRARGCLEAQLASFERFGDCIDIVHAGCRPWIAPPFGARDCLEGAHHTWRYLVWQDVGQMEREERGGRGPDGRLVATAINAAWEGFAAAHCAVGSSPAHPPGGDDDRRRLACLTELAAAQAVRLFVTLAP